MHTKFIFWGAILAGLAVVFGAFGTHVISPYFIELKLAENQTPPMEVFQTGVHYQFFHALALIVTGILYRQKSSQHLKNAGLLFMLGILLFSGSLYLMTFGYIIRSNFRFIGAITPLGGISLIVGWGLIALSYSKKS